MAELRLRVAKVGATVETGSRLRISTPVVDSDGGGAPSGGARARARPGEGGLSVDRVVEKTRAVLTIGGAYTVKEFR